MRVIDQLLMNFDFGSHTVVRYHAIRYFEGDQSFRPVRLLRVARDHAGLVDEGFRTSAQSLGHFELRLTWQRQGLPFH